jgi:hypothetical protein
MTADDGRAVGSEETFVEGRRAACVVTKGVVRARHG